MLKNLHIEFINQIAVRAGKAIMGVYDNSQTPEYKTDGSPLTDADKLSHEIITKALREFAPDIPIISEEGEQVPYEMRKEWEYFWLVDPLDGTKEFLKHNGEFTVNIALVESSRPVLGVIYVPALHLLYYGTSDGAFRKVGDNDPERIRVDADRKEDLVAVRSRSHTSDAEDKFLSNFPVSETISAGSSMKFCLVAEGKAHVYYRHGPTMEWDTAAGHAIALSAGATVAGLSYGKPDLHNQSFVCCSVSSALDKEFISIRQRQG